MQFSLVCCSEVPDEGTTLDILAETGPGMIFLQQGRWGQSQASVHSFCLRNTQEMQLTQLRAVLQACHFTREGIKISLVTGPLNKNMQSSGKKRLEYPSQPSK